MSAQFSLLTEKLRELLSRQETVLIALEGHCGSGKTTLAGALAAQFDCNVFHMDDFFLRPEQRTRERLAASGGNVDYERFYEEVLLPLKAGREFSYHPYDCKTCSLKPSVGVMPKRLSIIEGSYSTHPYFGDSYDLKVFLDISPDLQRMRITQRPPALQERFFREWIPMEHRYFEAFSIAAACDILWDADKEVNE